MGQIYGEFSPNWEAFRGDLEGVQSPGGGEECECGLWTLLDYHRFCSREAMFFSPLPLLCIA